MKGLSIPQLSFDNYSEYLADRNNLNAVTTKTSYHIEQTVPVPDGFYTTYPNIEQDGRDYLMTDSTNISIRGGFYVKNNTPYTKELYWRDTGFSRTETLTSGGNTLQIGSTAVFGQEINAGERNETQHIQSPLIDSINNEHFGYSVSIYEDYLAVGTDKDRNGKVYIFNRNQATGVYEHQKTIGITNGGTEEQDELYNIDSRFGSYLAITDKYLAIAAPYYPEGQDGGAYIDRGRVYLYKRLGTNWVFLKKWDVETDFGITSLKAQFGTTMSLTNDILLVGSPETNTSYPGSGKLYIFGKNYGGTDNWGHIQTLEYPGSNNSSVANDEGEEFGFSNDISGDYIVVGADMAGVMILRPKHHLD